MKVALTPGVLLIENKAGDFVRVRDCVVGAVSSPASQRELDAVTAFQRLASDWPQKLTMDRLEDGGLRLATESAGIIAVVYGVPEAVE